MNLMNEPNNAEVRLKFLPKYNYSQPIYIYIHVVSEDTMTEAGCEAHRVVSIVVAVGVKENA